MNDWIFKLLLQILSVISGPLRTQLTDFAKKFREDARKTANPWDDILADIICWLLQVD